MTSDKGHFRYRSMEFPITGDNSGQAAIAVVIVSAGCAKCTTVPLSEVNFLQNV